MTEYILRSYIRKMAMFEMAYTMETETDAAVVLRLIEDAPAADVAPVVHGQWIIGADDDDFDVKCSKCGWNDIFEVAGIAAVERIAKTMHYCLNCGARMDGGDSDAKSV